MRKLSQLSKKTRKRIFIALLSFFGIIFFFLYLNSLFKIIKEAKGAPALSPSEKLPIFEATPTPPFPPSSPFKFSPQTKKRAIEFLESLLEDLKKEE